MEQRGGRGREGGREKWKFDLDEREWGRGRLVGWWVGVGFSSRCVISLSKRGEPTPHCFATAVFGNAALFLQGRGFATKFFPLTQQILYRCHLAHSVVFKWLCIILNLRIPHFTLYSMTWTLISFFQAGDRGNKNNRNSTLIATRKRPNPKS